MQFKEKLEVLLVAQFKEKLDALPVVQFQENSSLVGGT